MTGNFFVIYCFLINSIKITAKLYIFLEIDERSSEKVVKVGDSLAKKT